LIAAHGHVDGKFHPSNYTEQQPCEEAGGVWGVSPVVKHHPEVVEGENHMSDEKEHFLMNWSGWFGKGRSSSSSSSSTSTEAADMDEDHHRHHDHHGDMDDDHHDHHGHDHHHRSSSSSSTSTKAADIDEFNQLAAEEGEGSQLAAEDSEGSPLATPHCMCPRLHYPSWDGDDHVVTCKSTLRLWLVMVWAAAGAFVFLLLVVRKFLSAAPQPTQIIVEGAIVV